MLAGAQLGITLCTLGLGMVTEPAIEHLLEPVFAAVGLPDIAPGGDLAGDRAGAGHVPAHGGGRDGAQVVGAHPPGDARRCCWPCRSAASPGGAAGPRPAERPDQRDAPAVRRASRGTSWPPPGPRASSPCWSASPAGWACSTGDEHDLLTRALRVQPAAGRAADAPHRARPPAVPAGADDDPRSAHGPPRTAGTCVLAGHLGRPHDVARRAARQGRPDPARTAPRRARQTRRPGSRPATHVPEAVAALQDAHAHLGLVTDGGGEVIGMVDLTDLLGELLAADRRTGPVREPRGHPRGEAHAGPGPVPGPVPPRRTARWQRAILADRPDPAIRGTLERIPHAPARRREWLRAPGGDRRLTRLGAVRPAGRTGRTGQTGAGPRGAAWATTGELAGEDAVETRSRRETTPETKIPARIAAMRVT